MLEKTVETYLVDRVRAAGGDAYKFSSPARVSVPDRIVIFPPARIYFVELKRPGGVVTKGQLREHERLRALGCDVRVIDSREAVDAFVQETLISKSTIKVSASKVSQEAPAPYLYVYEYQSPFGGVHREFEPFTWNGQRPTRTVSLYTKPQTDKSRADALTDAERELLEHSCFFLQLHHSQAACNALRKLLLAVPVEQHEAAPAGEDTECVDTCGFYIKGKPCACKESMARHEKLAALNQGHGWVNPRPDGAKARCGGPAICHVCQAEQGRLPKIRNEPPPMPACKQPKPSAPLEGTGNGANERAAFERHQGYPRPEYDGAAQEAWDYHRKTWCAALAYAHAGGAT